MKVTLRSRVVAYISGISLELFLLHGFWIDPVFYEARMPDMAFFGLVLVCSIAAASLAAPVTKAVVRAATGFLLRHREKEAEVPLTLERQNLLAKKPANKSQELFNRFLYKSWPPYDPRGSAKKYITVILKQTGSRSGKNACPGSS